MDNCTLQVHCPAVCCQQVSAQSPCTSHAHLPLASWQGKEQTTLPWLLKLPASAVNSHASHLLLFKQPELSLSE